MTDPEVIVVGAGAAGLASALRLRDLGFSRVVIYDRNEGPGGILPQCIHAGFGVHYFGQELTGPEYSERLWSAARERRIETVFNASVLSVDNDRTTTILLPNGAREVVRPRAVIIATGCRERTRENLEVAGTRPAGVFTAGLAQTLVNRMGLQIGSTVVIQGSGDIGMIMARRMSIEGYTVVAVLERLPYLGGTLRNKIQCLDAFRIPLWLSSEIIEIEGDRRVQGVKVVRRTSDSQEIQHLDCDTVLVASGLIAETRLIDELGVPEAAKEALLFAVIGFLTLHGIPAAVPSCTGAARATGLVLEAMKGRLDGSSLRVPVADGSITDFTAVVEGAVDKAAANAAFAAAAASGPLAAVLDYSEDPIVSSDIVGSAASCTFDAPLTMTMPLGDDATLVKVFGWYDNEWGYSNRLVDLVSVVGGR